MPASYLIFELKKKDINMSVVYISSLGCVRLHFPMIREVVCFSFIQNENECPRAKVSVLEKCVLTKNSDQISKINAEVKRKNPV